MRDQRSSGSHPLRIERDYLATARGQLHLRKSGQGGSRPPLVMLHQVPNSGQIFEPVMSALAEDRLVLAIDTPGYGMSDPIADPQTIEGYAEVIGHALRERITVPVDIVGYHTGAAIAAVLASSDLLRVRRLALVAVPVLTDTERKEFAALPPIPFDEGGEWAREEWRRSWYWRGPGQTLDDVLKSFAEKMRPSARQQGARAIVTFEMAEALRVLRQPLLIVRPKDDLWEATARAIALRPDAMCVTLPDFGLGLWSAAAERMVKILREFLDAP